VIFLALTCYFLLFALVASLIMFAPARAATSRMATRVASRILYSGRFATRLLWRAPQQTVIRLSGQVGGVLAAHRRLMFASLAIVALPPIVVLSLQTRPVFDFIDRAEAPDRHIALLLEGEQLTAPPALPPEIFTTREVELVRPATAWASRDWELLDVAFRQRLLSVFKLMREQHGYEMVLLEGYRSPERQAALKSMGEHVTGADAGMSYHQYGLAADSAFLRDGQLVISERDPWAMQGYRLYGELAAAAGLTWGGDWRLQDLGHVELRRPGVLAPQGG
jgi:peptidoglycan L-alanyl-D-glutamate endopeptidase CwlK